MPKRRFKQHLVDIKRVRTSVGRDLQKGLRLDRNERVTDFPQKIMKDLYKILPSYLLNAYPDVDRFYDTLSKWLKIPVEQLYVTNAITEGIRIVFETLVSKNDEVVIIEPTFPMYKIYGKIYQAKVKEVTFRKDFTLDVRSLCDAINERTSLVCIPNPNLPIESVLTLEEIRKVADKCRQCGTFLVIDEAYAFFGTKSAMPLLSKYDNIIIFQTFSKAFGLAGVRLGYMISTKENIEYLSKTRSLVESNALSMSIGEYMLKHPKIMYEYVTGLKQGKEYVQKRLSQLGIRWSGGNFSNGMLIFLNDKQQTQELLEALRKKKIYLRGSFEYPIENCVRLTLGPKPAMARFMREFEKELKCLKK